VYLAIRAGDDNRSLSLPYPCRLIENGTTILIHHDIFLSGAIPSLSFPVGRETREPYCLLSGLFRLDD
jgi:hypothetical protein